MLGGETVRQRSVVQYADDEFHVSSWPEWLNVLDARLIRQGLPPARRPVGEAPAAAPVYARLEYARWLADCDCGAAVMLFRGPAGQWFWCPSCGNPGAGGKLRPVVWPADREQITKNRETLPAQLAHWKPGDR